MFLAATHLAGEDASAIRSLFPQNPHTTGVCLLAVLLGCLRKRNQHRRRVEKLATLDMLNKRRPAPSVSLAVEGMADPDSPDQVDMYSKQANGFLLLCVSCFVSLFLFVFFALATRACVRPAPLSCSQKSCVNPRFLR